MSAWLCSENHLNLIANVSAQGDPVKGRTAFNTLRRENLRSLSARYPGRDFLVDWQREAKAYRFKPQPLPPIDRQNTTLTLLIKQCDCFDYQACETDDYNTSKAARIVDAVRKQAIAAGGLTEGALYDAQPWGID